MSGAATGWTGGQYSLFRFAFGAYLSAHFAALVPWGAELFSSAGVLPEGGASPLLLLFPNVLALYDAPAFVTALLCLGALLGGLLALGVRDRWAALALWYLSACLFGRNPLIANPALPFVGWLLLAHACLPRAPYGAWDRRRSPDPGTDWRFPPALFAAAWIVMALAYSYSGYTKLASPSWLDGSALARVLANPLARPTLLREWLLELPASLLALATWGALALELCFAPLALIRRLRPPLWLAMTGMHLGLVVVVDFADLSLGMLALHGFTFDPAWVRPRPARRTETVFYDGGCGLCHRVVRFLLAEDAQGTRFEYAPLQGERFRAATGGRAAPPVPETWVLQTQCGELLERSAAVLVALERLGGIWRLVALLARLIPEPARDTAYRLVARTRYRVFGTTQDACPLVTPELRKRFRL